MENNKEILSGKSIWSRTSSSWTPSRMYVPGSLKCGDLEPDEYYEFREKVGRLTTEYDIRKFNGSRFQVWIQKKKDSFNARRAKKAGIWAAVAACCAILAGLSFVKSSELQASCFRSAEVTVLAKYQVVESRGRRPYTEFVLVADPGTSEPFDIRVNPVTFTRAEEGSVMTLENVPKAKLKEPAPRTSSGLLLIGGIALAIGACAGAFKFARFAFGED